MIYLSLLFSLLIGCACGAACGVTAQLYSTLTSVYMKSVLASLLLGATIGLLSKLMTESPSDAPDLISLLLMIGANAVVGGLGAVLMVPLVRSMRIKALVGKSSGPKVRTRNNSQRFGL